MLQVGDKRGKNKINTYKNRKYMAENMK